MPRGAETRITELGYELPTVPRPAGSYVLAIRALYSLPPASCPLEKASSSIPARLVKTSTSKTHKKPPASAP